MAVKREIHWDYKTPNRVNWHAEKNSHWLTGDVISNWHNVRFVICIFLEIIVIVFTDVRVCVRARFYIALWNTSQQISTGVIWKIEFAQHEPYDCAIASNGGIFNCIKIGVGAILTNYSWEVAIKFCPDPDGSNQFYTIQSIV